MQLNEGVPDYIPFESLMSLVEQTDYSIYGVDTENEKPVFYIEVGSDETVISILFTLLGSPKFTVYVAPETKQVYVYNYKTNTLLEVIEDLALRDVLEMVSKPYGFLEPVDFIFDQKKGYEYYYVGENINPLNYQDMVSNSFFDVLLEQRSLIESEIPKVETVEEFELLNDAISNRIVGNTVKAKLAREYSKLKDDSSLLILDGLSVEALEWDDVEFLLEPITVGISFSENEVIPLPIRYNSRAKWYPTTEIKYFDKYLRMFYKWGGAE